jgi:hypothetical protein
MFSIKRNIMKKAFAAALAATLIALGSGMSASAQDYRVDLNVGAAWPENLSYTDAGEAIGNAIGQVFAVIFTFGLYKPHSDYERVENLYLPALALQGGYQVLPWLQVTGDMYYHYANREYFTKETDLLPDKTRRANRVALLPGCKFTFLNKGAFKMYASVALGAGLVFHDTTITTTDQETGTRTTSNEKGVNPRFTVQTVPLGFSVGRALYGFADVGIGSEYTGFRGGIGYRF